jgi:hypothetical protein
VEELYFSLHGGNLGLRGNAANFSWNATDITAQIGRTRREHRMFAKFCMHMHSRDASVGKTQVGRAR